MRSALRRARLFPGSVFYGWWVVLAALLAVAAQGGAYYSYAVLFKAFEVEFGWSRTAISGGVALELIIHGLGYICVGALIDRYGVRRIVAPLAVLLFIGYLLLSTMTALWQLFLYYGVIVGIAYSCGYGPLTSLVPRWFTKRRGLALGLVTAGFGLGAVVMPPLMSYLIWEFSWRTACIAIGSALLLAFGLATLVLRRDPAEKGLHPYGYRKSMPAQNQDDSTTSEIVAGAEQGIPLRKAITGSTIWVLFAIFFLYAVSSQLVTVHVVNYAIDMGIAAVQAATILSVMAACSIIGRLTMGAVSDRLGTRLSLFICMSLIAVAVLLMIAVRTTAQFYLVGMILGFGYGGELPLIPAFCAQAFGLIGIGAIVGLVTFGAAIGAGLGPLLAGYVFDMTGSYNYAFVFGGICAAGGALLCTRLKIQASFSP